MSDSPFDGLTPIGKRSVPPDRPQNLSPRDPRRQENQRRRNAKHDDLHASHPRAKTLNGRGGPEAGALEAPRMGRAPAFTDEEAKRKVARLIRKNLRLATTTTDPKHAKNYAVTAAVLLDKWLLLSSRPTTIFGMASFTEDNRAAVRDLGVRLIALNGGAG